MNYWRFFPASEDGWGRVPVWGFADVVASRRRGPRRRRTHSTATCRWRPISSCSADASGGRRLRRRRAAPRRAAAVLQPLRAHRRRPGLRPGARGRCRCCCARCSRPRFLIDDAARRCGLPRRVRRRALERLEQDRLRHGVPARRARGHRRRRPDFGGQRRLRARTRLLRPCRHLRRGRGLANGASPTSTCRATARCARRCTARSASGSRST